MASVVVSLVFALRSAARSRAALHLEILALRHQLAVLNRSPLATSSDRGGSGALGVAVAGLERLAAGAPPQYLLLDRDAACTDVVSTIGAMQCHPFSRHSTVLRRSARDAGSNAGPATAGTCSCEAARREYSHALIPAFIEMSGSRPHQPLPTTATS